MTGATCGNIFDDLKIQIGIVVVSLGLLAGAFFAVRAVSAGHAPVPGCYHVVDVSGKDWYFADPPKFDLNVGAIQFENDQETGWIFPASVEVDIKCVGQADE